MRYYRDWALYWLSALAPWFIVGWAGVDAALGDWRGVASVCIGAITGIGATHFLFWYWSRQ